VCWYCCCDLIASRGKLKQIVWLLQIFGLREEKFVFWQCHKVTQYLTKLCTKHYLARGEHNILVQQFVRERNIILRRNFRKKKENFSLGGEGGARWLVNFC